MLSPEQVEWHEKVRNALNADVRNPNFVLHIDVEPGAGDDEPVPNRLAGHPRRLASK